MKNEALPPWDGRISREVLSTGGSSMYMSVVLSAVVLVNFLFIPWSSAQDLFVIGEIRTAGKLALRSEDGTWLSVTNSYPIVRKTAFRTFDDTGFVNFGNGSKLTISKNTDAVIERSGTQSRLTLNKGVIFFDIASAEALEVVTPSADIYVNEVNSAIPKLTRSTNGRTLGVVSAKEKNTEVRSIKGEIFVKGRNSGSYDHIVATGESMLIDLAKGPETCRTAAALEKENTQAVKTRPDARIGNSAVPLTPFFGMGGLFTYQALRHERVASPWCPRNPCN